MSCGETSFRTSLALKPAHREFPPLGKREGGGMNSMSQFHSDRFKLIEDETYAVNNEFQQLFATEMTDLFRLSLNLTAAIETAERCLILAMRECLQSNSFFNSRKLSRAWARRVVIRNAIHLVQAEESRKPGGSLGGTTFYAQSQPNPYRATAVPESLAVINLPDFDRLVYVICVLEHYSIAHCAFLLSRSEKEVNDARVRAVIRVVAAEERHLPAKRATFRTGAYEIGSHGEDEFDGACGLLLN
jgi:DNA-directed RNA polymerase specialized sigma24 family protein